MSTIFIKAIFFIITIIIFFYCSSYAKFEITSNNNIFGGLSIFIFSLFCVIFSNYMFFNT